MPNSTTQCCRITFNVIDVEDSDTEESIGVINIGGFVGEQGTPITLADGGEAVLLTLQFTYLGGNSAIAFDLTDPDNCEYAAYAPDFLPFCDRPHTTYYINGGVDGNLRPIVDDFDLVYSEDEGDSYNNVVGSFEEGFVMCIDPTLLPVSYWLNVDNFSLTSELDLEENTMNEFFLENVTNESAFLAYWAARGVDGENYGDWRDHMWLIINGEEPFFYVKNNGTDVILVDGMQYELLKDDDPDAEPPLTLPGDYPQDTYTYRGTVVDVNECESLEFDIVIDFITLPTADAGADEFVCNAVSYQLEAIPSVGTGLWTQVDGPTGGEASFTDAHLPLHQ